MKHSFSKCARTFVKLKYRLWRCCTDSRDRRCTDRMKPFLLLFKSCGMFANEISQGRLKRCSRPSYGICVFWISVYFSYVCFLFYKYVTTDSITIRLSVEFSKHLIGYTSLTVNVIAAYTSQNQFAKFFDRMDSYDYEVARVNQKRGDNLLVYWIATILMMINVQLIISVIFREKSIDVRFFIILSDICLMSMHMYGTLEKFLLLHLMLERFKHINNKIAPNIVWDEKQCGPQAITVEHLKILHSMLYDAQRAFNDIYKNPLLVWFAFLMMYVVANVRVFREETPMIACVFVAPGIMQLLTLCTICHYTAEEANRIPCVLSEYMTSLANTGDTMTNIGILTYFLNNRVSFEAAGFFTINLPLFQSVVATVTTYFIILI